MIRFFQLSAIEFDITEYEIHVKTYTHEQVAYDPHSQHIKETATGGGATLIFNVDLAFSSYSTYHGVEARTAKSIDVLPVDSDILT